MDSGPPERETRRKIERDLATPRRTARIDLDQFARELGMKNAEIEKIVRRRSHRRPPGMAPALVEPPRGPRPLQGGAAAPLEFDS